MLLVVRVCWLWCGVYDLWLWCCSFVPAYSEVVSKLVARVWLLDEDSSTCGYSLVMLLTSGEDVSMCVAKV